MVFGRMTGLAGRDELVISVSRLRAREWMAANGAEATIGVDAGGQRLELNLFGQIQGVVHLNPKVSDCAFQFGWTARKFPVLR